MAGSYSNKSSPRLSYCAPAKSSQPTWQRKAFVGQVFKKKTFQQCGKRKRIVLQVVSDKCKKLDLFKVSQVTRQLEGGALAQLIYEQNNNWQCPASNDKHAPCNASRSLFR